MVVVVVVVVVVATTAAATITAMAEMAPLVSNSDHAVARAVEDGAAVAATAAATAAATVEKVDRREVVGMAAAKALLRPPVAARPMLQAPNRFRLRRLQQPPVRLLHPREGLVLAAVGAVGDATRAVEVAAEEASKQPRLHLQNDRIGFSFFLAPGC